MRLLIGGLALAAALACVSCGNTPLEALDKPARLTAQIVQSGFGEAHDSYNAVSAASDGRIYYVLSSERPDLAAQMYVYDPVANRSKWVGDLNKAAGEENAHAIAQGKSHVSFVESEGKLYFATHIGFYSIVDGMETPGIPPKGMKPYQGGHFLSYDMASGKYENLAMAPNNEGIIALQMDTKRKRLYGLSWPTGRLLRYDVATKAMKDAGPVTGAGEAGRGDKFRTICRSLTVDPEDGTLYFSTSDGKLHRYLPDADKVETVPGEDLRKDYFGVYDPASSGSMAYNWRQTFWYAPEKAVYGVHGNSGYLFRFRPAQGSVEVLDRITSLESKRSGMFDQFSYGYLGFALGPDGRTIYFLTGGPIYASGRRVTGKDSTAKGESKGREDLHLVTWDIPTGTYADHGAIYFASGQRPNYVNSIAVGKDGSVYALSRVSEADHAITDLIRVPPVKLATK